MCEFSKKGRHRDLLNLFYERIPMGFLPLVFNILVILIYCLVVLILNLSTTSSDIQVNWIESHIIKTLQLPNLSDRMYAQYYNLACNPESKNIVIMRMIRKL